MKKCDHEATLPRTRREALAAFGSGLGMAAFAMIATESKAVAADNPWAPKAPHFPAKAKNVIAVFLAGGLSQIDSFDYKPMLDKYDGKPLPYETPRTEFAVGNLMKSPFTWQQYGSNGIYVSQLFPYVGEMIDDFTIVRSMISDIPNHAPSVSMMTTGSVRTGRPSWGSWVTYGLGTENQNLPGFIALSAGRGSRGNGSAFLPSVYQGTAVPYGEEDPKKQIQYLAHSGLELKDQRSQLDFLQDLNQQYLEEIGGAPELEATIQSMEVAYHMQTEAPEVFDIRTESDATREMYGKTDFAQGCLTARRLVEKGVRFVQVNDSGWDHHADINGHIFKSKLVDQPIAALVKDLKQRGMLDETLVLVVSEFGRTPVINLGGFRSVHNGRDHNIYGFTVLAAGGGMKPGCIYGATDDFGFKVAENPVHVHDFHATVLHTLGLDHERLTYRYSGRDFRLTDVEGTVVKDILA